jgi:hypothetical protein
MPYADPEKRRAYAKAYQKKWKAENRDKGKAYSAKYRKTNAEKLRQQSAAYRVAHLEELKKQNRERARAKYATDPVYAASVRARARARARSASPENKEAKLEAVRQWRKDHPDKQAASSTNYRKKNPAVVAALHVKRRTRATQQTPAWANKEVINAVYQIAAAWRTAGVPTEVDHIVPLAGKLVSEFHSEHNLRVVPRADNRRKWNRHVVN